MSEEREVKDVKLNMTNIYRNTERRKGDMHDYRHMRDQVLKLQNTANIIQIFN